VANFRKPPVGEVSFGLRFAPLTTFRAAHFGMFWDLVRSDYPECEDKPQFYDPTSPPVSVPEWFPYPRVWYVHRNRNLLLQLQPNGIWLNWRRLNEGEPYPRFERLFPIFRETVERFANFARGNNLGDVAPAAAELLYVNHIPSEDSSQPYSDVGEFMQGLSSPRRKVLPAPDGVAWRAEFTVADDKLSVDLKSGKARVGTQERLYILEIRAWVQLNFENAESSFPWFIRANKLIVDAFCDVTTEKAQREYWQRTE
jgi:uncharacterized protein (TIGR04255 family)